MRCISPICHGAASPAAMHAAPTLAVRANRGANVNGLKLFAINAERVTAFPLNLSPAGRCCAVNVSVPAERRVAKRSKEKQISKV